MFQALPAADTICKTQVPWYLYECPTIQSCVPLAWMAVAVGRAVLTLHHPCYCEGGADVVWHCYRSTLLPNGPPEQILKAQKESTLWMMLQATKIKQQVQRQAEHEQQAMNADWKCLFRAANATPPAKKKQDQKQPKTLAVILLLSTLRGCAAVKSVDNTTRNACRDERLVGLFAWGTLVLAFLLVQRGKQYYAVYRNSGFSFFVTGSTEQQRVSRARDTRSNEKPRRPALIQTQFLGRVG